LAKLAGRLLAGTFSNQLPRPASAKSFRPLRKSLQSNRRLEQEDLTVLAYRFAGDPMCKAAKFEAYRAALGDRFIGRTLENEAAN